MKNLRIISAEQIAAHLDFSDFIEALRQGFRDNIIAPARHHHKIEKPGKATSTMLLMPAWTDFGDKQNDQNKNYSGVKIVNVHPDNGALGKASVQAMYVLNKGDTGEPVALIDGEALTLWRTSCASALASEYLSNKNSKTLLMVGAGALAPWLIRAHMAVRPIEEVLIWNRTSKHAVRLAARLQAENINARPVSDIRTAVEKSNIVTAATLSTEPLILGEWLTADTHIDLVGGFTPTMREADDLTVRRASLFVDTMAGALHEAGDITQPLENGVITRQDILADLSDLTRGIHNGRSSEEEITLFKSTGAALEDLVGAILIAESVLER